MEVNQMANTHKRNLLYYWYATNIYSIRGRGFRRRLPVCLVDAVRAAFPEPDGVYRDFIPSN